MSADPLAFGQLGIEAVEDTDHARDVGSSGCRHHAFDTLDQRQVERIDAGQSILLDLDGVEEPGVAAVRVADAIGDLVEPLAGGLDVVDRVQATPSGGCVGCLVEGLLALVQPAGQMLPLNAVGIAAELLVAIALEQRDGVGELLQKALGRAGSVEDRIHGVSPRGTTHAPRSGSGARGSFRTPASC
jgi:hypothetical protein